ncbi:SET domain-containing protein [Hesseltinella vesiculosa]|uniref:SET domain-containing protein n=1 Tax=Hesseltinella vesiculosa TaxID=101127 RepID=A0A1X2GB05_9FUNG|nr:SET domain-containing protein [Hesseltinella vesiculosa]
MSNKWHQFNLPDTIRIQSTPGKGRECIATQTIPANTTLLTVLPYVTGIFDNNKKRLCAVCVCTHPTKCFSLHCASCDQVYFCSAACRDAYTQDHRDSGCCDILRKLASLKKVDRHCKSVAKLVVMIYWQRRTRPDPLVDALESHYDHWPADVKLDWHRVRQFLWQQFRAADWLRPDETDTDIMHLASKIESNSFGLYLERRADVVAGRALYLPASMFNHDCDNNCEVEQWTEEDLEDEQVSIPSHDLGHPTDPPQPMATMYPSVFTQPRGKNRQMFIKTTRDVQANEPLTISYIDTQLPVATRRQLLAQDYYFACTCLRCAMESATLAKSKKQKSKKK